MSESTSLSQLLAAARSGHAEAVTVRALGETNPSGFFHDLIEPLADSFDPADVAVYECVMQAWLPVTPRTVPAIPHRVDTVYVLSRVTLGADVKITSIALDAMKRRFPDARIVLAGGRKAQELFAADPRISALQTEYPRSGPVSERIAFGYELRDLLSAPHSIVIDPDSRLTQLGLVAPCAPERHFHFPSRAAGGGSLTNLTTLTQNWLQAIFGVRGSAFLAPETATITTVEPFAAISLGVGGNMTKRIAGSLETDLIRLLGERYTNIWADRGAGGEEAARITAAVESSGVADRVHFWEGSFAGFASIAARSALYVGYDSAGQHAAAAADIPLVTIFAGATSARFRARWSPCGAGPITVIDADALTPDACLRRVRESWTV